MEPRPIRLLTYLWEEREGSETLWYAECVTLNLVTCRSSFDEVSTAIRDQIESYLDAVSSGNVSGLVPRYSPLRRRLALHLRHLIWRGNTNLHRTVFRIERPFPGASPA